MLKTLGAILGSGGGLTLLIKWWTDRQRKKKVDLHVEGLRDLVAVYEILNDLISGTPACRALIIKSTNGGGVPRPDKQVLVSVMNEVFIPPFEKPSRKWQARPADEHYSKLLLDLVKNSRLHLETAKIPSKADLRVLYEADGVNCSDVFIIHLGPTELVYLSLNYPEVCDLDANAEALIRQKLHDLKMIYEKYRNTSFENPDV